MSGDNEIILETRDSLAAHDLRDKWDGNDATSSTQTRAEMSVAHTGDDAVVLAQRWQDRKDCGFTCTP